MTKELFFCVGEKKHRRKWWKIFGEGKLFFFAEENKNGEGKYGKYLEKVSMYLLLQRRRKRRIIFGEGKYIFCRGEGKGGKYIFCGGEEERRREIFLWNGTEEEKEENICRRKMSPWREKRTNREQ